MTTQNPTHRPSTILVSGATGTQGGAVARALLRHGHTVRAMTRNPQGAAAQALQGLGATPVAADFDDPQSLRDAAAGVDAVYAMGTPYEADADTEERQARALLDAAVAAEVPFVVYSSVASALEDTGVPHFESKARVERHLATLPIRSAVVAPAMFADNMRSADTVEAVRSGTYTFPAPADLPIAQVAITDLAEFTALVFDEPERFVGSRIEIASDDLDGAAVADALSQATGHPVSYTEVPLEAVEKTGNDDLVAMLRFFRERGYDIDVPALHATYPEVGWHGIREWASTLTW